MLCCAKKPVEKEPQVDVEGKLKELEERLSLKIQETQGSVTNNYSVDLTQLKEQFLARFKALEQALDQSVERHTQQLHELRQELTTHSEKHSESLGELRESSTVEVQALRSEFSERLETHHSELRQVDEKHMASVQELSQAAQAAQDRSERLHQELQTCHAAVETQKVELHKEIEVTRESTSASAATQGSEFQGGLDEISAKLVMSTSQLERSLQSLEQQIQTVRAGSENGIADCLERMVAEKAVTRDHVQDLREAICENALRIDGNTQLAENVYCRAVRWNCRGFQKRLAKVIEGEAREDFPGVCSPDFSLCSLPPMQLELCLAARTMAGEEAPIAPLPVPGSCSVRVWAEPGIEMTFRITLGDGAAATSRRFDFSFLAVEGEARSFFEVQNFCLFEQVWTRREDMIPVTFELLEFKTQPMLLKEPEVPELAPEEEKPGEGEEAEKRPSDELYFTRSATAELLLHERLQKDLVSLRNRTVRRVEWRLEGCSRLLECCRSGDSVDSPIFSAAGLERIQFHFFPRGYEPTSGSTSPCSLFVSGPDRGVAIRGLLWVGSQGRQFEHRFKSRGDMGGRPKFGPLEQLHDPQDGVMIAVDLAEVEQELPEHNQSIVLRDARASTNSDTSPLSPSRQVSMAPQTGTRASMRLKREDPSKTEELVKCVSLPSLKAGNMSQMSMYSTKSRRSHDY